MLIIVNFILMYNFQQLTFIEYVIAFCYVVAEVDILHALQCQRERVWWRFLTKMGIIRLCSDTA